MLVQVVPASGEEGELIAGVLELGEVHLHQEHLRGIVCLSQHFAPGRADHGVAVGDVALLVPGGADAHSEQLGVHGAAAQEQLPVSGTGGQAEGGGDDDRLGARLGHQQEQLGEADVKADADAQLAELGVEQGQLVAGGEGGGLLEVGAVVDGGIKEMNLAMACRLSALSVKDKAGVIELLPI